MKQILVLTALCAASAFTTAHAENPGRCDWQMGPGSGKKFYNVPAPASMDLRRVAIGSVLASSPRITIHSDSTLARCPGATTPMLPYVLSLSQGELAPGFSNVYNTGIRGVGVRFVSMSAPTGNIPLTFQIRNNPSSFASLITAMRIDYIRTERDVAQGDARMDYKIQYHLNGWNAAEISIGGTTRLQSQSYFSGCAGVEKLNIPMGRVVISHLPKQEQKPFNLDVLCSGMAAGSNVPVKVYFEGSSEGPGRLNLEPGGAQGVEISLRNDRGVNLPFSQGSALTMAWTRSEPGGEIYRLPVVAAYTRKGVQKVVPGKANATLNYILEYN